MESVRVISESELDDRWRFEVAVGEEGATLSYAITLEKDYWQKLTGGKLSPISLVKRSFEYLLIKEKKENILRSFHLSQITDFYPDYEVEVKKLF